MSETKGKRKVTASAPELVANVVNPAAAKPAFPVLPPLPLPAQFGGGASLIVLNQEYIKDFLVLYQSEDPSKVDFKQVTKQAACAFYAKHKSFLEMVELRVPVHFLQDAHCGHLGLMIYLSALECYQRAKWVLAKKH